VRPALSLALDLTPDLAGLSALSVYAVVCGLVFVESGLLVGFFLPGDSVLFAAGLLSAERGSGVSLGVLTGGVLVAAVTGDSVGYAFGRRLGRPWLVHRMARGRLDPRHLRRAEVFYERYGWHAVVAARWIPWLRTFTPILAGTAQMPYGRFLSANLVGAAAWAAGLVVLGNLSARNDALRVAAYVVAAVFVLGSLGLAVAAPWPLGCVAHGQRDPTRSSVDPWAATAHHRPGSATRAARCTSRSRLPSWCWRSRLSR